MPGDAAPEIKSSNGTWMVLSPTETDKNSKLRFFSSGRKPLEISWKHGFVLSKYVLKLGKQFRVWSFQQQGLWARLLRSGNAVSTGVRGKAAPPGLRRAAALCSSSGRHVTWLQSLLTSARFHGKGKSSGRRGWNLGDGTEFGIDSVPQAKQNWLQLPGLWASSGLKPGTETRGGLPAQRGGQVGKKLYTQIWKKTQHPISHFKWKKKKKD